MPALIRPARAEELPKVAGLVAGAGLPVHGLERAWATWVAEEDDVVVGTASLERHGADFLLRSVVVAPDRRGQRIGTALVRTALRAADGGQVWLLTDGAASWFPRFGFVAAPREQLPPALARSPLLRSGRCCEASLLVQGAGESSKKPRRPVELERRDKG